MTDPTVVLVSVGADSAALIDEIERKGLRVVSCPFAEAEEAIERERPLLVVLHGARGAVELSTMLEDAEDPPQVAVVAARAELGTLMGLNRDIVVSLLATELTEKTVAARLEAVVRQRAKTLGLSLNLAARRASMGPRPSLPRPPPSRPLSDSKPQNLVLDAPTPDVLSAPKPKAPAPPSLGQLRPSALGPSSDDGRGPAPPPRLSGGTAIGLPSPGRPDAAPPVRRPPPRDPSPPVPGVSPLPHDLSASLLLSDIPAAEPPRPRAPAAAAPPRPAPPRPAPARPPIEPDDSSFGSDAPTAVISLTPSVIESLGPHESTEAPRLIAPAAPPVPRFEPSELLSESGLDDSVGPDLRAALDLARPPTSAGGVTPPPPNAESEPPSPEPEPPGSDPLPAKTPADEDDDLALPLLRPAAPLDSANEDFTTTMLTEVTMPAIPGSLAAEALAEARLRSEPNHPIPEPPPDLEEPDDDRATVTNVAALSSPAAAPFPPLGALPTVSAERAGALDDLPPKRAKAGWAVGLAIVAALGGTAAYVKWGMPKPQRPNVTKEPASPVAVADHLATPPPVTPTDASAGPLADGAPGATDTDDPDDPDDPNAVPSGETPPAEGAQAEPAAEGQGEAVPAKAAQTEPGPAEPAPVEPVPGESDSPPADAPTAAAPPAASGDAPAGTEPAVLLDNPFATPDANLAGCEQLAPGAGPTTADPVTEASTHWSAARKSIVKGDVEAASRSMCLATAINPQSPAVEGLARLYTLAHSPKQALVWIERAIQLAPTNRELLNLRGDAKSQLGRQEEATQDWLDAMGIAAGETKRRTNQAAEYVNMARTERGRIDLAKAEQFYRRALGFEEANLAALTGMAELLLARKLYDQAGSFAVKALAVFEPVPEAYLVLGDVAVAKNDPARARASYERALAIRPDFWPAKTRLRDLPK